LPRFSRLRALVAAALAALVLVTIQPPTPRAAETLIPAASPAVETPGAGPTPTPTPTPTPAPVAVEPPAAAAPPAVAAAPAVARARTVSKADRVIAAAMAERGRPWAYGATGPRAFDCSGLVVYSFRRAGVLGQIGSGRYRGGSAMFRWARAHHLTRATGHRGDVVVWGNGAHVGIYLGNGKAISTLTSGVRVHGLRVLSARFTTFISTGLSGTGRAVPAAKAVRPSAAAKPKVIARRTVATTRLNIRSAPRVTAAASRVVARGTTLGVIRSAKDAAGRTWYRVVVGSRVGWVAGWLTRPGL
jgi:cell wall-associated NlpC family hydrolase